MGDKHILNGHRMAGVVLSAFSLFSWPELIGLLIWVSVCNGVFVVLVGRVLRKDIKCMTSHSVRRVGLIGGLRAWLFLIRG